ncbi:hypothetical protein [Brevibacillus nitrificans]|uniref:hypothetical protein n=1 Tax=Brevibacillus nitrificans TaxID=651560 RepID=UPI0011CDF8D9|nr:hypothetical protein [Brevibacillus nitrificans]
MNQGITFTSKAAGSAGNSITINIKESLTNPPDVFVTENVDSKTVTIEFTSDDRGRNTATVDGVVAAANTLEVTLLSASGMGTSLVYSATVKTSGAGETESVDLTVETGARASGRITVTVFGIPHVVSVAGQTPSQVAQAIATQLTSIGIPGYTVTNPSGAIVRFVSLTPNTNVPDITVSLN